MPPFLDLPGKQEADLVSAIIRCPVTGQTVVVEKDMVAVHRSVSECSSCGSHGAIELEVACKCGKTHWTTLIHW